MNIEATEAAAEDEIEIEVADSDESTAKDDDIIVEKAEERPKKPDKQPKKAEKSDESVEEGLRKLREQVEAEKNRRIAAEKQANEAAQSAHKSKAEAQDANLHLITTAMRTLEQEEEVLKANYAAAAQSGDYSAMADAQASIARNAAKMMQLEQGKQALENAPKEEAPKPFAADPVEALASQLSPRSASWVRGHPEFASEPRKYQAMLAAHNLAIANGEEPDTDSYFEAIEDTLRIRRNDDTDYGDVMSDAAKPVQRRSSPPAAPVSRSAATSGGNANRVTLSAAEREIASNMGMTDQEYARNKLALIKEGRLN